MEIRASISGVDDAIGTRFATAGFARFADRWIHVFMAGLFICTVLLGFVPDSAARRVLIVDDNVDAANSLALLLKFQDHAAQVAYSGADALACVEAFRPEVGLIDIGLPGMNGYELARHLRAMPQLNCVWLR